MKKILLSLMTVLALTSLSAQTYFTEDFESGTDAWTFFDADGDQAGWEALSYGTEEGVVLTSASWTSDDGPLTPDNWAVSSAIDLTSATLPTLYWSVMSQDQAWADENITVYVATSSDIADLAASGTSFTEIVGTSTGYMLRTMDLSSFVGSTVYVGLRHHDVTDMFRVNIADVMVKEMLAEDVTLNLSSSSNQAITSEGGTSSFDFNVVSYGSEQLSGYTFNYSVNGNAGSMPSNQSLNSGDVETFSIDLGEGNYQVTVYVTNSSGEQVGESYETNVSVVPPVPQFVMQDTYGNTHDLHSTLSKGTMVLLDFFASWCGPCETSTPEVNAVWEEMGSGTLNYETFGITTEPTDDADVVNGLGWGAEYPKFAYSQTNEEMWSHYDGLYGEGGIPFFVLICPNPSSPGFSDISWTSVGWAGQAALVAAAEDCMENVSIDEVFESSLSIYPNPASDYATVNISLVESQDVIVEVVNTLGQKVMNVSTKFDAGLNTFELPIESLASGMYHVNIKTSNVLITEKLNIVK